MVPQNPAPDENHFDWRAAEADVADVVDLGAARTRRATETTGDTHLLDVLMVLGK